MYLVFVTFVSQRENTSTSGLMSKMLLYMMPHCPCQKKVSSNTQPNGKPGRSAPESVRFSESKWIKFIKKYAEILEVMLIGSHAFHSES